MLKVAVDPHKLHQYLAAHHPQIVPAAKKIYRHLFQKNPLDLIFIALLYPLRIILRSSFTLFSVAYTLAGKVNRSYKTEAVEGFAASEVERITKELKENGIAIARGCFTPEQIAEANLFLTPLMERSRESTAKLPPHIDGIRDEINPQWEHTRELFGSDYDEYKLADPSLVFGRTRTRIYDAPPALRPFINSPLIQEVSSRYIGYKTKYKRILVEELTPSLMSDGWHVDCAGQTFKAMVLLSDCTAENGPMRYKVGSHRFSSPVMRRLYYLMFRFGYTFSAITYLEHLKIPGKVLYGTGKAGDCIFFDPSGAHSGSRCLSGNRRALILPRTCINFRNKLFAYLGLVTI